METRKAIELAGSACALARLLGVRGSAVSQWGERVPKQREWQLRLLRPSWFSDEPNLAEDAGASLAAIAAHAELIAYLADQIKREALAWRNS